jgi:hypothetical protein
MAENKRVLKQFTLRQDLFGSAKYDETEIIEMLDGEEKTGSSRELSIKAEAPAHEDLRKCIKQLTVHMLLITEQIGVHFATYVRPANEEEPIEGASSNIEGLELSDVDWAIVIGAECHSLKIDGQGDDERVSLTGSRFLEKISNGLSLSTPSVHLSGEYQYRDALAELLEQCKHEIYMYSFERKYQPEVQQDLFASLKPDIGGMSVESAGVDENGRPTISLTIKSKKNRKKKEDTEGDDF